jgi:hypothetical protein
MLICYLKRNYPDALRVTVDRRAVEMDRSIEGTPSSSSSSSTEASSLSGLDTSSANDVSNPDNDGCVDSGEIEIGDLVEFYKAAKKCFDEDESFKEASRLEVVQLQSGRWM